MKLELDEIRMRSIEACVNAKVSGDSIANLLIHSRWIAAYVESGASPEVENLPVTDGRVIIT